MPQFSFFIWNKQSRVRYPRSFDLPDTEAARAVALKIAQAFGRVVPGWDELPYDRQTIFVVEVDNEAGQTILTVPFRDVEERSP